MELLAVQSFPSFPVVFMVLVRHLDFGITYTLFSHRCQQGGHAKHLPLWIKKNQNFPNKRRNIPNINNNN